MNKRSFSMKAAMVLVPTILLIVVLGVGGAQQTPPDLCSPLTQLYQYIQSYFYWPDRVEAQTLQYGAMKGMVEKLDDPYSEFLDPQERTQWEQNLEGQFSGIGIEITIKDNVLTVIAPLEGTPAEKAGLEAGDQILQIGGASTEGITLTQASTKIRGDEGTTVVLHVRHKDGKEEDLSVVRGQITVAAVRSEVVDDGKIGYIRLSRFDSNTSTELDQALATFDMSNLDGFILDLRNNPGGYTSEAIQVSSHFVDSGTIYFSKGKLVGTQTYTSMGNQIPNLPLAVLVNGGTASASEITAGAIRDNNMGILIGQKTFGKGVMQTLLEFGDGSALKLTVGEFFTPLGHTVHEVGLTPDIVVPDDGDPEQVAISWIHDHVGSRMPMPIDGTTP